MAATACIAAQHGSFSRIRQMAPICTLIHGSLGPRTFFLDLHNEIF